MLKTVAAAVVLGYVPVAMATLQKVSVDGSGNDLPGQFQYQVKTSCNGRFVAFMKDSTLYRRDLKSNELMVVGSVYPISIGLKISCDGDRVAYHLNHDEYQVLEISSGKKWTFKFDPKNLYVYPAQMSSTGRYVLMNPGSPDSMVVYNLDEGSSTSLPNNYSIYKIAFAEKDDVVTISDFHQVTTYDLSNGTSTSLQHSDLGLEGAWCEPLNGQINFCGVSSFGDIWLIDLAKKTMSQVTNSSDGGIEFDTGDYALSPSGKFLYYMADGFSDHFLHRLELGTGQDQVLAKYKDSLVEMDSLSAGSGQSENLCFGLRETNVHSNVYEWRE